MASMEWLVILSFSGYRELACRDRVNESCDMVTRTTTDKS